jgi:AraC-like DNA-binding protein
MSASSVLLVRQFCTAQFRALFSDQPMILRVREGEKRIQSLGRTQILKAGDLGVVPARLQLEVENHLSPNGRFVAQVICLGDDLQTQLNQRTLPQGNPFKSTRHDRALHAFDRACTALDDSVMPARLRENAVLEVLLWLAEDGIGFEADAEPRIEDRVRSTLAKSPDRKWQIVDVAKSLALSESTLRRRLAEANTSFNTLLIDVRMVRALALLQTTTLPIGRVAAEVGYESASRFAVRFRARHGISPSAIRGLEEPPQIDGFGTAKDRIGTGGDT